MEKRNLHLPISESEVRKLRVGDAVYLTGIIHAMGETAHRLAVEKTVRNEKLPFNLQNGAIWHCGPVTRNIGGRWEVLSAGPESSSRFTELAAKLIKDLNVRIIIGKGTMGSAIVRALADIGGVYLMGTGGCGAFYASKVVSVEGVNWEELSIAQAVWTLKVEKLGPLIVGIDSEQNVITENIMSKILRATKKIFEDEQIVPGRRYIWWPRTIIGPIIIGLYRSLFV